MITVLFSIAAVGYFIYLLVSVSVFSENERFRGDVSPDGKYEITVTTHDAGLLTDGETYVNVRRTAASGALFGQLKYKPQRIYKGGELEYEMIEIEWISNDVLSINGKPYTVDGKEVVLPEPEESSLAEETSAPVEESEQSDASADELSQSASGEETSAE